MKSGNSMEQLRVFALPQHELVAHHNNNPGSNLAKFLGFNVSARSIVFGSRGPFVSDTSPKSIDCEGLGECRTVSRQSQILAPTPEVHHVKLYFNVSPTARE